MLLGNLFRDQLDRYGELETIADRWAGDRRSDRAGPRAQRRRPARRRPRPPRARARPTSASTTTARAARAPARVGLQALPPLRPRLRVLGGLPRPPRPLHVPELRPGAPAADRRRDRRRAARHPHRRVHAAAGGAVELPLPGLYNVYNALGAAALTLALGVALDDVVAGLQARRARLRPRRDARPRPPDLDPARQEPGRRQRGAAHARAGGRASSTCSACSTTAPPTAATSRGCGTPTGSCSSPACGASPASGTRAAELALRMKYAGLDPARIHVVDELERGLDAALGDGDGPLYVVPTYTALLELRELLDPPRPGGGVLAMTSPRTSSGTTSSAAATTPTCRCGASSRGEADGVLDVGAGTGRVALAARARRPRRHRARHRRRAAATCCASAPRERACTSRTLVADAADFTLDRAASA